LFLPEVIFRKTQNEHRPQRKWRVTLSAALAIPVLGILSFCVLSAYSQPPESATTPPPSFNASRAFSYLEKQVTFGPRVPGTPAHQQCRDWLIAELQKSAHSVARQDFIFRPSSEETIKMTNIVAQFNPDAKKQVFLCAHWDTRPTADQENDPEKRTLPIPGANDGASGVAVLLELAKLFAAKPLPPNVGVQIALFDGEDYGPNDRRMYLGAKAYARRPLLPRPDYAILIDMIGDKELSISREGYSQAMAPEINNKIWKAASELGIKQFVEEPGIEITDDHLPLQQAGWKAVDLIDFDYPYWHTLADIPDKCSPNSLKVVGDVLARVVYSER